MASRWCASGRSKRPWLVVAMFFFFAVRGAVVPSGLSAWQQHAPRGGRRVDEGAREERQAGRSSARGGALDRGGAVRGPGPGPPRRGGARGPSPCGAAILLGGSDVAGGRGRAERRRRAMRDGSAFASAFASEGGHRRRGVGPEAAARDVGLLAIQGDGGDAGRRTPRRDWGLRALSRLQARRQNSRVPTRGARLHRHARRRLHDRPGSPLGRRPSRHREDRRRRRLRKPLRRRRLATKDRHRRTPPRLHRRNHRPRLRRRRLPPQGHLPSQTRPPGMGRRNHPSRRRQRK
mmetsp:Transcript_15001/g.48954  ORF Transcript_15001/g.48954 Transcript_15001/m.48954 type:complete len:291 (+) Transcript_15001:25-897(+)